MLLLSPITWQQHCVGVLPAFYLVARTLTFWGQRARETEPALDSQPFGVGRFLAPGRVVLTPALASRLLAALALWTFWVLLLNRTLVGRSFTLLLDSYHVVTWSLVMLLVAVMACHRQVTSLGERAARSAPEVREWAPAGSA
jgi:hypothetical protein